LDFTECPLRFSAESPMTGFLPYQHAIIGSSLPMSMYVQAASDNVYRFYAYR